ncbi:MAG: RNA polymerase sporulation sigma factor SigH [Acidimicrobiales bacterium]
MELQHPPHIGKPLAMAQPSALHPRTPADLGDDELAERFQAGDQRCLEALVDRYRRFVRAKANGYFLAGGDADDVEQEALIGLYKAARDFRPRHQASFRSFADLCVTRQIITAIKTATRQKHQHLNRSLSVSGQAGPRDDDRQPLEELLVAADHGDPLEAIVARERTQALQRSMADTLSSFEMTVLRLHVRGSSYLEISQHLGRPTKAVDNALQRIKRKLGQRLVDEARADRIAATRELTAA